MALCLHVSAAEHSTRLWHPLSDVLQLPEHQVSLADHLLVKTSLSQSLHPWLWLRSYIFSIVFIKSLTKCAYSCTYLHPYIQLDNSQHHLRSQSLSQVPEE